MNTFLSSQSLTVVYFVFLVFTENNEKMFRITLLYIGRKPSLPIGIQLTGKDGETDIYKMSYAKRLRNGHVSGTVLLK